MSHFLFVRHFSFVSLYVSGESLCFWIQLTKVIGKILELNKTNSKQPTFMLFLWSNFGLWLNRYIAWFPIVYWMDVQKIEIEWHRDRGSKNAIWHNLYHTCGMHGTVSTTANRELVSSFYLSVSLLLFYSISLIVVFVVVWSVSNRINTIHSAALVLNSTPENRFAWIIVVQREYLRMGIIETVHSRYKHVVEPSKTRNSIVFAQNAGTKILSKARKYFYTCAAFNWKMFYALHMIVNLYIYHTHSHITHRIIWNTQKHTTVHPHSQSVTIAKKYTRHSTEVDYKAFVWNLYFFPSLF